MTIAVAGAGAFGTALAIVLGRNGRDATLWCRSKAQADALMYARQNDRYLPGIDLPQSVSVTADSTVLAQADTVLLAVPMQATRGLLAEHLHRLDHKQLVACAKGMDLETGEGPTGLIAGFCPNATTAVLTGPSFAADIARGLPTALTLACKDAEAATQLQALLSTPTLRLYRTDDVTGAEIGGALKNVIAISAGVVMGAGLGESARASLITRGYAEIVRLALAYGARAETLQGLSGLGDLFLTCTSAQSRNFSFGVALGAGQSFDKSITVEGVATARAAAKIGAARGIDLPVTAVVCALVEGRITVTAAMEALMTRPLRKE